MKQRAEYKRREERIQSVGRLGNPILLNFLAEEAAWTFIGKKTGSISVLESLIFKHEVIYDKH